MGTLTLCHMQADGKAIHVTPKQYHLFKICIFRQRILGVVPLSAIVGMLSDE